MKKALSITIALMIGLLSATDVVARSAETLRWYSDNQIMFYDEEENCVPSGGTVTETSTAPGVVGGNTTFVSAGNEHGHWEGGCSGMGSYDSFLRKYNGPIRTAAARNGAPWEAMIAQMIIESGGGVHEVCANNPLGLKGEPSCDGQHRIFGSHEEAFDYYFSSIIPVKRSAGRFSQNPYSYIEFIEYGDPNAIYAEDSQYVTKVSDIICGVQKWAQANGIPISAETYANFKSPAMSGSGTTQENPSEESTTPETPTTPTSIVVSVPATNTCPSENGESEDPFVPESGELVSGGMNLAQARAFMEVYRNIRPRTYAEPGGEAVLGKWQINRVTINKATNDCWSNLENCVAVVQWFICEYGGVCMGLPNGGQVVSTLLNSGRGFTPGGHTPKPYAVFSKGGSYGHTGIVLGVDKERDKIIIGEAGCACAACDFSFTGAKEHSLSSYTSGAYTYAYTDGIIHI